MSLIRSKWQEASAFIIISAKVSVMDVECSWKTSMEDWAWGGEKKAWVVQGVFSFLFFMLTDKVWQGPWMANESVVIEDFIKFKPDGALKQQGRSGQQVANSQIECVDSKSFFLDDKIVVCVCVGWVWMERMSRLRHGTAAGLAGQLCFYLWSFKLPEGLYCLEISRTQDVTIDISDLTIARSFNHKIWVKWYSILQ